MAIRQALHFLCFTLLLIVSSAEVLQTFTKCNGTGKLEEVRITPCPVEPCALKHNTKVGIEIDFIPNAEYASVKISMYGILIEPLEVAWNGVDKDACPSITDGSGKSLCPITDANKKFTYRNQFEVKASYPAIPVTIKVTLQNPETEDNIVCFKFKAVIVD